jgi:putative ubiquitin-RnfH superfamily antitoxin RatB of RatAB toxin-antitoxin module
MGTDLRIAVTVVYSPKPRKVLEIQLALEEGSTVAQALDAIDWATQELDAPPSDTSQGIWGKKVGLNHVLRDHDRLEIYRSLVVDPKVARRERLVGQGAKRAAGLFAARRAGAKAGY